MYGDPADVAERREAQATGRARRLAAETILRAAAVPPIHFAKPASTTPQLAAVTLYYGPKDAIATMLTNRLRIRAALAESKEKP
jgi:hypothetical protein